MTPMRLMLVAGMVMSSVAIAVPPALDRVPIDAAAVMVVPSLARLGEAIEGMGGQFGMPMDAEDGPGKLLEMLEWPGIDANGSAAIAILGEGEELDFGGDQGPVVAIVPVTDYQAFVTRLGGEGAGLEKLEIDGEDVFIKSLGDGFAAMGPLEEIVSAFEGRPGQGAAHEARAGAAASRMLEQDDVVMLVNVERLRPMLEQAMQNAGDQAEMAGQGEAFAGVQGFVSTFLNDAGGGAIGMDYGDHGVVVDLSAQFKDGSTWAQYANVKANASPMLGRIPAKAYLFAFAMDLTSPALKGMFRDGMKAMDAEGDQAQTSIIMSSIDKTDGVAMVVGTSPAGLMGGGLLLNSSSYIHTSDAAGYLANVKKIYADLNGKTLNDVTYQSTYKSASGDVGGKKVDEWSLRMKMDPNAENAGQAQQMQMMIFGPAGGPGGYIAPAGQGVVMTYGKNSAVMQEAMQAAEGGAGFGGDAGVTAVASRMPSNRVFEAYVGVKGIMDMVMPFLGMMIGPVEFEVPASMPPIGLGGSVSDGGMHMAVVVPADVLNMVRDLGKAMEAGAEDAEAMDEDGAGQPRF